MTTDLENQWKELRFGVEIEFIGGRPQELDLLPGWIMSLDEKQIDETGMKSGSELKPPPLRWEDRGQLRIMLDRLAAQGAAANWSCGLHVHVELAAYGESILLPLLEAALRCQDALARLLGSSPHRRLYCPPVAKAMAEAFRSSHDPLAVRHFGRPQSHRCGINIQPWFDIGTVEIRYANGSLDYGEIMRTVELCLRFVAAVGAGAALPDNPEELAAALNAPFGGYPPPIEPPRWFKERMWLEEAMIPVFTPLIAMLAPEAELHHILPVPDGLRTVIEFPGGEQWEYDWRPTASGWERFHPNERIQIR
ncbi:amidoligase family protein [Paenibacillus humicus]|uniref:amidoligase family protein n=1 Tax=Paenibacillus humicus TaxID=412861 RepID=UPI003F145586